MCVAAAPPSASKQRAVYLANMAACDVALKQYKEAVQACTAALEEDATFVKVRDAPAPPSATRSRPCCGLES